MGNDIETIQEISVVPDGYYDYMLDSVTYNNFVLSLVLGMFIIALFFWGMRK